ncbi:MAG: LamG domain-containing protein [Patescibacteria group bacterium]
MRKIITAVVSSAVLFVPAVSLAAIQTLNGLNGTSQTFATSTATSSHLSIQSSGTVHTFSWDGTSWTMAQGGTGATTTMATGSIPFINNGIFSSTAQLVWDAVSALLNIGGTTTPAAKLSVKGSGSLDVFNVASSTGASLLFVTAAGNVGIGTTTPFEKLEIVGNVKLSGSLQTNTLVSLATSTLTGRTGVGSSTAPQAALDISGSFYSRLVPVGGTNVDWNAGNVQSLTLTSNPMLTFTNGQQGGEYKLILNQDATGGRTVAWPGSIKWLLGSAPKLATTSNSTDIIGFIYDGINYLGFPVAVRSSSTPPSSLLAGLLSYWKFDEPSGDASDSSGNGKTLTNNASTTFVGGKINNAVDLERDSSQFFSRSNGGYYDNTAGTVSCWVNPESVTHASQSFPVASTLTNVGSGGFHLDISRISSTLRSFFGAGNQAANGTTTLATSTWYMATFTWNTAGKTLYLNGMPEASNTNAETMTAGETTLYIGNDKFNEYFDGMLDECGIWNRVLSPSEITTLYNSGSGLQYPF